MSFRVPARVKEGDSSPVTGTEGRAKIIKKELKLYGVGQLAEATLKVFSLTGRV
jgi:hypothetical protein